MRLNEFQQLQENQQVALLYEQGVYIGKRRLGSTVIILYQLEGFYAEVVYRTYRREIRWIDSFSETGRLDPYLAGMDVEHLVL
jgi:hypothetical protein